ncbi:hypothetical protein BH09PAT4_BH09PAT4_08130 [soil metagenome]
MEAETNLFTQYSALRAAKRSELEAEGRSEAEVREALRFVVPALVRPKHTDQAVTPATGDLQPDTRWDVPDSEGSLPSDNEASAAVMGRLATHYQAFQHGPATL